MKPDAPETCHSAVTVVPVEDVVTVSQPINECSSLGKGQVAQFIADDEVVPKPAFLELGQFVLFVSGEKFDNKCCRL